MIERVCITKTKSEVNREEKKISWNARSVRRSNANLRWREKFVLNFKIFIVLDSKVVLSSCLHAEAGHRATSATCWQITWQGFSRNLWSFGANKSYSCQNCHLSPSWTSIRLNGPKGCPIDWSRKLIGSSLGSTPFAQLLQIYEDSVDFISIAGCLRYHSQPAASLDWNLL